MSTLEFLLQNAARRAEAQPQKGSFPAAADGKAATGSADASNFDALLQTLSNRSGDSLAQVQQSPLLITSVGSTSKGPEAEQSGDFDETDSLPEDVSDGAGSRSEVATLKQDMTSTLQAGFPSLVLPQSNSTPVQQASSSAAAPGSLLELISPKDDADAREMMQKLASASSMKASVVHQEAHFKPILPNSLPTDASGQVQANPKLPLEAPQTRNADMLFAVGHDAAVKEGAGKAASGSVPVTQSEVADPAASASILQRIASAVAAESAKSEMQNEGTPRVDQTPASIVLKPSEGVLRVLNIQLHPVELGVVTVKMRLSGEQLEMELHTSSDETADILRKDSDKLSGLLRSSGYRADIVTIHVTASDAAQQDTSAGQRQQWGAQSQSGGFQQGQAGQEERAKRSSSGTDGTGHKAQNGSEDVSAVGAHASGVYL